MGSRIAGKFRELRKKNGKAFIPYIMAGDPDLKRTHELISVLEGCGADIIHWPTARQSSRPPRGRWMRASP